MLSIVGHPEIEILLHSFWVRRCYELSGSPGQPFRAETSAKVLLPFSPLSAIGPENESGLQFA